MSPTVPVTHPAPVRLVPARGRVPRTAYVAMCTPIRLAERDRRDFVPLGPLRREAHPVFLERYARALSHRELLLCDGDLWIGLRGDDGAPVSARALSDYLSGDPGPAGPLHGRTDLDCFFHASPVVARSSALDGTRGMGDAPSARQVLWDGRERAPTDLADFLGSRVALVEGNVMGRVPDVLLRVCRDDYAGWPAPRQRVGVSLFPRHGTDPAAIGRIGDSLGLIRRLEETGGLRRDLPEPAERPGSEGEAAYLGLDPGFPHWIGRSGPAMPYANACHRAALHTTAIREAMPRAEGELAHLLERSARWAALGAVLAIRPDEFDACVSDLAALLGQRLPGGRPALRSPTLETLLKAAGAVGRPALPAVAEEDAGELLALAP